MIDPLKPGDNFRTLTNDDLHLKGTVADATLNLYTRRNRPLYAAANEYKDYDQRNSLGYALGQGLHKAMVNPNPVSRTLDKGPWVGGLLGGLGAAAMGYGGSRAFRDRDSMHWLATLLAGGVGAAAGAYSGNWRSKRAGWRMGNDGRQQVMEAINSAPGLSFQQRSQFMLGVSKLPDTQVNQLASLLRTATGFGVGALVAKFLSGAGLGGMLLGGLIGGVIGNAFNPRQPKDGLGRPSLNNHDMFGNPFI